MQVAVKLPARVVYAWWMCEGGETHLVRAKTFVVPTGKRVKVVAYGLGGGFFACVGVAIFKVTGTGEGSAKLHWPHDARSGSWGGGASLTVSGTVEDLAVPMRAEVAALMQGRGTLSGMNKFWKIDWEWPFRTPGWVGLREIDQPTPGWHSALPWLEYHGLCVMGKRTLQECSPGEARSVIGIAIGGAGYLDEYDQEPVDDTTPRWSSFGTGNDCDDFAVAAASLVNAARRSDLPPNCDLHRWIKANVVDSYVVSGIAWPQNRRNALGDKTTFGHMWLELGLKGGDTMIVECTAAVAYYGGVPCAAPARVGSADGPNNEYLSAEYHWYGDRAYAVRNGVRQLLDAPTMPGWYDSLRFRPPGAIADSAYAAPGLPPSAGPVMGFHNTRKNTDRAGVSKRIFPFSAGEIVWSGTPQASRSVLGSFK